MFKETVEVALPSLASNVVTRERVPFVFKESTCSLLLDLCFAWGVLNSANLLFDTMSLSGLLDALSACPPQIHWIDVDRSLPLRLLFISHLCSWRPLCLESACLHCLQGMSFSCPQMLPTGSILSYRLFVPIFVLSSSMYFEFCQFSDFHCGHLKKIQDGGQIPCRL